MSTMSHANSLSRSARMCEYRCVCRPGFTGDLCQIKRNMNNNIFYVMPSDITVNKKLLQSAFIYELIT